MKAHLGPRFWVLPLPTKALSPAPWSGRWGWTWPWFLRSSCGSNEFATESQTIMHLVMTTRRGSSCKEAAPTVCQKTRNTVQESCSHNYINEIIICYYRDSGHTNTERKKHHKQLTCCPHKNTAAGIPPKQTWNRKSRGCGHLIEQQNS